MIGACRSAPSNDAHIRFARFDAREPNDTSEIRKALKRATGPLRAVVYAAAAPSSKRLVSDTPNDEFIDLFTVNALGFAAVWQIVAEAARVGAASVTVISSDTTDRRRSGNASYTASKSALEAIALTLAKEEAAHGVRVNIVAPSAIASPLIERVHAAKRTSDLESYYASLPWGRALTINEVADAITSIAVDDPWRYASGQVFRLGANL